MIKLFSLTKSFSADENDAITGNTNKDGDIGSPVKKRHQQQKQVEETKRSSKFFGSFVSKCKAEFELGGGEARPPSEAKHDDGFFGGSFSEKMKKFGGSSKKLVVEKEEMIEFKETDVVTFNGVVNVRKESLDGTVMTEMSAYSEDCNSIGTVEETATTDSISDASTFEQPKAGFGESWKLPSFSTSNKSLKVETTQEDEQDCAERELAAISTSKLSMFKSYILSGSPVFGKSSNEQPAEKAAPQTTEEGTAVAPKDETKPLESNDEVGLLGGFSASRFRLDDLAASARQAGEAIGRLRSSTLEVDEIGEMERAAAVDAKERIFNDLLVYVSMLASEDGSQELSQGINEQFTSHFSETYVKDLLQYYSQREALLHYTKDKELNRMQYRVRIPIKNDATESVLESRDEVYAAIQQCCDEGNESAELLFRAANQSLLADPLEILSQCDNVGSLSHVMRSVRVHSSSFYVDLVDGFVTCDADVRVAIPTTGNSSSERMELSCVHLSVVFSPGGYSGYNAKPRFECFVTDMTTSELHKSNPMKFSAQLQGAAKIIYDCSNT